MTTRGYVAACLLKNAVRSFRKLPRNFGMFQKNNTVAAIFRTFHFFAQMSRAPCPRQGDTSRKDP